MANTYNTPPKMPAAADYGAGQKYRARLMNAIGDTQNAAHQLAMRGGVSQGWPEGISTTVASGYSTAFTWRIPTWPSTSGLTIGMRHAVSVGSYGWRLNGAGAPGATAFGAGVASMLWNGLAYTRTTLSLTHDSVNGYRDVDLLLNAMADLRSISMTMDKGSSTLATSRYANDFTGFGPAAATEAGHAGLFHLGVDNLTPLSTLPRAWSAWSMPNASNVASHTIAPPFLAFPVWVPRGSTRDRLVTVHANVIMDGGGPVNSRADFYFGNPPGGMPSRRYGRFVGSTVSTNVNGEWDSFEFLIRDGEEIVEGLPGGWVNIEANPNLSSSVIDGTLAAVSVWVG